VVGHWQPVRPILEVDAFPLIVHVMLVVDRAIDDREACVDDEEDRYCGPDQAYPVPRKAHVELPIALKAAERAPERPIVRLDGKRGLFSAQASDFEVDPGSELGLHLPTLDHLYHLSLF